VRGGWPRCGEIDIMEFYRGSLLANVGWHVRDKADNAPGRQQGVVWWDDLRKPIESFNDPEWHTKFHVWRMDWDADHIKIYVDDELLKHVEIKHSVSRSGTSPFRQPHYLLLNLAIGGHGGDPAKTQFPARMEVDYVRIYQKQPEGPGAPEAPARSGQAPAAEPEGGSNAVLAAYADDRERDGPIP
jgi:beta-glucanase (GH16 family)